MDICISGEIYSFSNTVRENAPLRRSFSALAEATFGISFEEWYQRGYWGERYLPYALAQEGRVISNVSVNLLDLNYEGRALRLIQLGTVMTAAEYRHRGLGRVLLDRALADWLPKCDGMYLYANDSVTDFYPKFGFVPREEFQHTLSLMGGLAKARRMNMGDPKEVRLLLDRVSKGNTHAAITPTDGAGLLMFYCGGPMAQSVYYSQAGDAVVIADFDGDTMLCYDVFGAADAALLDILTAAAHPETRRVALGFSPRETQGMEFGVLREEDTTFFWHAGKPFPFEGKERMLPLLTHA